MSFRSYYVDAIAIRYYDANTDGLNIDEQYYVQDAFQMLLGEHDDMADGLLPIAGSLEWRL